MENFDFDFVTKLSELYRESGEVVFENEFGVDAEGARKLLRRFRMKYGHVMFPQYCNEFALRVSEVYERGGSEGVAIDLGVNRLKAKRIVTALKKQFGPDLFVARKSGEIDYAIILALSRIWKTKGLEGVKETLELNTKSAIYKILELNKNYPDLFPIKKKSEISTRDLEAIRYIKRKIKERAKRLIAAIHKSKKTKPKRRKSKRKLQNIESYSKHDVDFISKLWKREGIAAVARYARVNQLTAKELILKLRQHYGAQMFPKLDF